MENRLKERLWNYIRVHCPELMYDLQEEYSVGQYLDNRINQIMKGSSYLQLMNLDSAAIEDKRMAMLTENLGPSKFLLVKRLFREEFTAVYQKLEADHLIDYELLNILASCAEIFHTFGPNAPMENQKTLSYAIIGQIDTYLRYRPNIEGQQLN